MYIVYAVYVVKFETTTYYEGMDEIDRHRTTNSNQIREYKRLGVSFENSVEN